MTREPFSAELVQFQSMFQRSLFWFRRTAALVAELDSGAALHARPPMSA